MVELIEDHVISEEYLNIIIKVKAMEVGFIDGKKVGDTFELDEMKIKDGYKREGFGKQSLEKLRVLLQSKYGIRRITGEARHPETSYDELVVFYTKCGYTVKNRMIEIVW